MDKGAAFVHNHVARTLELIKSNPLDEELQGIKGKVIKEFYYLTAIKNTGNLYQYYLKFKNDDHRYSDEFKFIEKYNIIPNEKMADYLAENFSDELDSFMTIEDLIVGKVYSNNEIRDVFKCSDMGGMRRSKETNTLVLIAKHNNPLYDDNWTEEGILNYTGMGKKGDQSINFGQNKTLAMSNGTDIKIYLFESYKDNEYYFRGEVYLTGTIFVSDEVDEDGETRKVLKFPLKRKDESAIIINFDDIEKSEKEKKKELAKMSDALIKEKAKNKNSKTQTKEVVSTVRDRDPVVSEWTKRRAEGICDLCKKEAPFVDKNGKPYLEEHHVITLADGGPDAIYNTVALCPNCHRRIHILKSKKDIEGLQKILLKYLLADDDIENIKKHEELF